jgi:hypothetical protein
MAPVTQRRTLNEALGDLPVQKVTGDMNIIDEVITS